MEIEKFNQLKEDYKKFIVSLGYKFLIDCDKKHDTQSMFDLEMIFTIPGDDNRIKYAFYQIGSDNELSVAKFDEYRNNGKLDEFKEGFRGWINVFTFDKNDLIACLLHEGLNIEDIWKDERINLTRSTLKILMDSLNMKGSPLMIRKQRV